MMRRVRNIRQKLTMYALRRIIVCLDIDDNQYATFDTVDAAWLELLAALV